jgi:hypothetical protein
MLAQQSRGRDTDPEEVLKITDIGTRWKESWNITNEITSNKNILLIQSNLMYRMYYKINQIHKFYSTTAGVMS